MGMATGLKICPPILVHQLDYIIDENMGHLLWFINLLVIELWACDVTHR